MGFEAEHVSVARSRREAAGEILVKISVGFVLLRSMGLSGFVILFVTVILKLRHDISRLDDVYSCLPLKAKCACLCNCSVSKISHEPVGFFY